MIFSIVLLLVPLLSDSNEYSGEAVNFTDPTIRIYFSPLTTQAHIDEVQMKIVELGLDIVLDKITFSKNGYLHKYRATINPDCGETMKPIVTDISLDKNKLGATVIGDGCQHGSMNMSLMNKKNVTDFFFIEQPPEYELITWDGGMKELMKLKGENIFEEE